MNIHIKHHWDLIDFHFDVIVGVRPVVWVFLLTCEQATAQRQTIIENNKQQWQTRFIKTRDNIKTTWNNEQLMRQPRTQGFLSFGLGDTVELRILFALGIKDLKKNIP